MAVLDGRAFFAAVVTILAIIAILLAIMVFRRNRVLLDDQSILTAQECTGPPTTPTNLTVSNPQGDLIILEFLPVLNATSYESQISTVANFGDSDVLQDKTTETNSAAFGNLNLGAIYYFRARARNSCGNSDWSAYQSFSIAFNFPPRFVIADRNNPGLELCDNYNDVFVASQTDQVSALTYCSDIESFYIYNETEQSIRQLSRDGLLQSFCLTRGPGTDVFNSVCNGSAEQKWSYNSFDFSLCDANDLENGCIKIDGGSAVQKFVSFGPKNVAPITEIVINEV